MDREGQGPNSTSPSEGNNVEKLTEHLFRHEAGRIIAVLTRIFGFHNIDLVEDVVQDAFAKALNDWRFKLPANPSAWLIEVARNKAIDIVRRQRYQMEFATEASALLRSEYTASPFIDSLFLEHEIQDSQLQMIFACCHPSLAPEDQIALTLKTVSGFSVTEIATALLSKVETVKKRLQRARVFLSDSKIQLKIPVGSELKSRLEVVLQALYLLFNEGYNSSRKDELIRKDLCQEALRISILLSEHPSVKAPRCDALVSLLCLLSSRFEARLDVNSEIVLLEEQDREKWNRQLINIGLTYLQRAMAADELSEYQLQAAIVAEHSIAGSFANTNWERILFMYDMLVTLNRSPVILLNRAIVVAKTAGPKDAIEEMKAIPDLDQLLESHYLFAATLGELLAAEGSTSDALGYFQKAQGLTSSDFEKKLLQRKIDRLTEQKRS